MFDNRLTPRAGCGFLDRMVINPPCQTADADEVYDGALAAATYLELYETQFVMRLLELCAELDDDDASS
jgi:hypothetical protein